MAPSHEEKASTYLKWKKKKKKENNKINIIYQTLSVTDLATRREKLVLLHLVLASPSSPSLPPKKRKKNCRRWETIVVYMYYNQHIHFINTHLCRYAKQILLSRDVWAIPWLGGQTHSSDPPSLRRLCQDEPFCLRQQAKGHSATAHLRKFHPFWIGGLISVTLLKSKIKLNSCIVINPATIKLAQYLIPSA